MTSRITLTKIIASPGAEHPAREQREPGTTSTNANASWPAVISDQPGQQQRLRAVAVERHTDRHLHAGVHQELEHGEHRQLGGEMSNRSAASRPATPRELRLNTAST